MASNQAAQSLRALLSSATEEAARRGDRRLGTDHLLLGLLREPGSTAPQVLGVSLAGARATLEELDLAALAAVGIRVATAGRPEPAVFGRRLPPLTSGARAVLHRAMEESRPRKTGRLRTEHFLIALLTRDRPDPAAELLDALGVEREQVRARLAGAGPGGVT